jgi:hypothetical protein
MPLYKGWNAIILKNDTPIGHATNLEVNIDRALETYFEIQNRKAQRIVEGSASIVGKLTKAWIDTDFLTLLTGSGTLDYFDLKVQVGGGINGMQLSLYNCKFAKGNINVPQDGFLTEDYDILALAFGLISASSEHIVNGGFETGDLTGWIMYTDVIVQDIIKHSGNYAVQFVAWWQGCIWQTLSTPIPVPDIGTFGLWYKGAFTSGSLQIAIMFTDSSDKVIYRYGVADWTYVDIKNELASYQGKTVTAIRILSYNTDVDFYIDDVSLMTFNW